MVQLRRPVSVAAIGVAVMHLWVCLFHLPGCILQQMRGGALGTGHLSLGPCYS